MEKLHRELVLEGCSHLLLTVGGHWTSTQEDPRTRPPGHRDGSLIKQTTQPGVSSGYRSKSIRDQRPSWALMTSASPPCFPAENSPALGTFALSQRPESDSMCDGKVSCHGDYLRSGESGVSLNGHGGPEPHAYGTLIARDATPSRRHTSRIVSRDITLRSSSPGWLHRMSAMPPPNTGAWRTILAARKGYHPCMTVFR